MPPKKRVSAPPDRVYESARPKRQSKLPEQKKVVKSYGKKSGRRVANAKDDDTLTQMGWVTLSRKSLQEEGDDMDYEEKSKKRGNKRRKTMGDKPDNPPKYLTQTISQMDWSFTSAEDNLDNEENHDYDIYDGPNSSQSLNGPNRVPRLLQPASPVRRISPRRTQASSTMPPPQTPRRIFRQEIPSSESPATPLSTHSKGSARRSPLKEMSINAAIPFSTGRRNEKSAGKLPRLEVKDTFDSITETQSTIMPSTPAKKSSPAKSVRFAIPEDGEDMSVSSPAVGRKSSRLPQASQGRTIITEILDSDAESDEEEALEPEERFQASSGEHHKQNTEEQEPEVRESVHTDSQDFNDLGPETCYGEIGPETQVEAGRLLDLASSSEDVQATEVEKVQEVEKSEELDGLEENTFQERTQIMESQRLTSQDMKFMAPRTLNSDVFVSIHPTRVVGFLDGTRNHNTFGRPLPPTVSRIWMYETAPLSTLRYMAVIGPVKLPSQILSESGEGDAEFNASKGGKSYAYEILALYELANPLSLSELKSNEWLQKAPGLFNWVRPVVLDQLMANLMPPVFGPDSNQSTPPSSATDTQEAGEQLMSTIQQFTQPQEPSSSQVANSNEHVSPQAVSSQVLEGRDGPEIVLSSQIIKSEDPDIDEVIPSSQQESEQELTPIKPRIPGPSQATTVDLTQSQTPRHSSPTDIIFESPRRPIPSSTPLRSPTPRSAADDYQGPESLVPYSMASSQLLTKSQMLPEGLLGESVPGPPVFVGDSDDEDDDYYSIGL
ncbi:hypothetical protein LHYA1_G006049 [Lachnellula hyalina]|uniref:Uncharacterized protein n=1 Tax=Lachnellula hyalina TaxID=1316788 RepID=A0A8H8QZS5_9HELO|nr:uncharacterized protein LHYA1_G006049 [Lachnellula hyalina]TVY25160.1 hypothetical protein LHYA1_G006049 [Lachnellula hyalina]